MPVIEVPFALRSVTGDEATGNQPSRLAAARGQTWRDDAHLLPSFLIALFVCA
jgi:hypothetical protein